MKISKKLILLFQLSVFFISCSKEGTPNEISSSTIWNGPLKSFTKTDGSDASEETNQDRLTAKVWITRGNNGGQIYNAAQEDKSDKYKSPIGTEWAVGNINDLDKLIFYDFRIAIQPKNIVGKDLVLHLIEEDIYLSVKFKSWSQGQKGGFSYERSTMSN
tara:strand:+ start:21456 stop:21935 length:480 start_codon:yes stop_codon:yes gene_type:complete